MARRWNVRRWVAPTAVVLGLAASTLVLSGAGAGADGPAAKLNDKGELIRPKNYREWVFIGSPVTPHDMNGGNAAFPEFHIIYIDPASYKAYKETGVFPEGTTIVKELTTVGAKKAVSGNGYFMGDYTAVVATVKSAKQFPNEPGHWGYFGFGEHPGLAETAAPQATASCNACHQASADEDWVFTQYYPVLRAAKPQALHDAPMK